jgi:hypothetical protein
MLEKGREQNRHHQHNAQDSLTELNIHSAVKVASSNATESENER